MDSSDISQENESSIHGLETKSNFGQKIGLFNKSGTQLLESPPPDYLHKITNEVTDGRAEYFRFRTIVPVTKQGIEDSGELVTWEDVGTAGVDDSPIVTAPIEEGFSYGYGMSDGSTVFANLAVVPEIEKKIAETFSDREVVGMRGIAVALEDGVSIGGRHINTIQEILEFGGEGDTDAPAQTALSPKAGEKIGHRTVQWLIEHPQNLRRRAIAEGNVKGASSIFPALLIYDRDKFPPNSVKLPESAEERRKVVLKAYILDYPIP